MKIFVEVVEYETTEVIKSIPCKSEHQAKKVQSGIDINLNHDEYFTRIKQN